MSLPSRTGAALAFVLLAMIAIALPLVPGSFDPGRFIMPDLLFCLVLAWMLRRPDTLPAPLIAAIALLADAVLMRPFGLWAALLFGLTELVRANGRSIRGQGPLAEMLLVASALAAMLLAQNLVLLLTLSSPIGLGVLLRLMVATLLCYPVIALVLHFGLRLRVADSAGQSDRLGKVP